MKSSLFSDAFQEVPGQGGFQLQNERMLKVALSGEFMARQGAAVAWQGDVTFAFQGAGAKRLIKKLVTGEDLQLMKVSGQGDVFLADYAAEIHVLHLENDSITVNGANVLAFDSSLTWDLKRTKGMGGMAAQGLFNIVIEGTGTVALTTIGTPVILDPATQPTFCDPAAAVAWTTSLHPQLLKTDGIMKSLIGRGSGELFSLGFQGEGFVVVQPSEGLPWGAAASAQNATGGGIGSLFT
ncbi:MAG: AIM24 family protein [Thermoleophilia bacterium]|nr:AIM24 family protein [Thermoleophilia bacterium]